MNIFLMKLDSYVTTNFDDSKSSWRNHKTNPHELSGLVFFLRDSIALYYKQLEIRLLFTYKHSSTDT